MFDYVLIGAGSAGCVLAARLSENPKARVLLLEAGGADARREIRMPAAFPHLMRSDCDWALETAPQPRLGNRRMYWPRGRVLGGSSSINAMIYIRGAASDYDAWAAAGNPGWTWRDLLPYFLRAEDNARGASNFHNAGGPLRVENPRSPCALSDMFVDACAEAGIARNDDFNGAQQDGAGLYQLTQRRGERISAADAYLKPALARKNLAVRTGAQALRILFDGTQAVGAEYLHEGEVRVVSCTREVILCGGAVHSPHLLLRSGVGPAAQLAARGVEVIADVPGVGENLQDHLVVPLLWDVRPERKRMTLDDAETFVNLLRWMLLRRGPLSSNLAEAGAFVRTREGLRAPDVQFHFVPGLWSEEPGGKFNGNGFSIGVTGLRPLSRGRVTLAASEASTNVSATAPPVIDPGYLSDAAGEDLRTLLAGMRIAKNVAGARVFDGVRQAARFPAQEGESEAALTEFIAQQAHTLYHPVGTCKMGPCEDLAFSEDAARAAGCPHRVAADPLAVVNAELRVRGVAGLRVVDASIMPALISGNTNAPVIAIAERAADLIRRA